MAPPGRDAPTAGRNAGLSGTVAVVTGGGSGIGAASAAMLASHGATVVVTDVRAGAALDVVAPLGPGHMGLEHDVRNVADWRRVLEAAGRVDVLVNSAGIMRAGGLSEIELDDYHDVVAVNQTGVLLGMRCCAPLMTARGGGSIVNISSFAGVQGSGSSIAYTASKWAVRGMTRFAARELAPHRIRVNAIVPGVISTPMLVQTDPEFIQSAASRTPLGRPGTAAEVAEMVAFLASAQSAFMTGADFYVDGGLAA
jgi:3alpha(or 20beta)-hydroxysteroid dehydrogenase